jgi:uncharacterized protein (TIGR00661 family)
LPEPLKILIAPLDWGLGHTSRCIPLIQLLLQSGHEVVLAAEGAAAVLLQSNFPQLELLNLEGYRVRYSKKRRWVRWSIMAQLPRILKCIRNEREWLSNLLSERKFDLVISDNRYGLYHSQVPNIILTHQLQIKTGWGLVADNILRRAHYRMLNRFQEIWIVDTNELTGFSGDLAHPVTVPSKAHYIGILSQFLNKPKPANEAVPSSTHILLLLSGPEPMRGQLEALLLKQATSLPDIHFTLVAGNPKGEKPASIPRNVRFYLYLNAADLYAAMQKAKLVVCRSGYSTIMDLLVLQKKALLVPTPGQTEQEYLATHLKECGYFDTVSQQKLILGEHLTATLVSRAHPYPAAKYARLNVEIILERIQVLCGGSTTSS